jgi:hypothetical protein
VADAFAMTFATEDVVAKTEDEREQEIGGIEHAKINLFNPFEI